MSDEFEVLKQKFNNMVPAQALFFKGKYMSALRVEAPTIGKEFTDSAYIGSDPEGWLFFNSISDFDEPTTYISSSITNPIDKKTCALVSFSFTNDLNAGYYAQFLAYDPADVVSATSMNGHRSTGNWTDLKLASITAHVNKTSTGTIITMTIDAIDKKAQFTDSSHIFPARKPVSSKGMFSFKSLSQLSNATYASYNKDRIVFYTSPNAKDFIGYFIPFEGATVEEINANSLGDVNHEFSGITWSNT